MPKQSASSGGRSSPAITVSWIWLTVVNLPEGYWACTDSPSFIVKTHRVTAEGRVRGGGGGGRPGKVVGFFQLQYKRICWNYVNAVDCERTLENVYAQSYSGLLVVL